MLDIVAAEEPSSIVTEDCMFVVLNLLKNNASNQELFREQGCVFIPPWQHSLCSLIMTVTNLARQLLYSETTDPEHQTNARDSALAEMPKWTQQRVTNVVFVLQVVRCLVSPSNPAASTAAAQRAIFDSGLFADLCEMLMATGVTVDVLAESLMAVADVMRANARNQAHFARMHAPDAADKTATLVLLLSLSNERQPHDLRAAVLYCFEAYVHRNADGKAAIINTLLPANAVAQTAPTAGHYLCSMLVANEPLQVCCECCTPTCRYSSAPSASSTAYLASGS